jgi:NAD(P)-dependent dehydrogenase (short-subunit alcohol dehydrogenase family)
MPAVLVTGASRGIGRSIACRFATNGWDVVAGVRTEEDAARIGTMSPRISPVPLDVTDAAQIAALDDSLPEHLDAVVNNAGISLPCPVEALNGDDLLRQQLEVNLVGAIAVTRAVLPRLRRSAGRIVFISSINGRVSFPLFGGYSASKFALEAAADALRMELKPWNVDVIVVQPGETDTNIWRTMQAQVEQCASAMPPDQRDLYGRHWTGLAKMIPIGQKLTAPPEKVAEVVEKALNARHPRTRYAVGLATKAQLITLTKLPAFMRDRLLRAMLRQPGRT